MISLLNITVFTKKNFGKPSPHPAILQPFCGSDSNWIFPNLQFSEKILEFREKFLEFGRNLAEEFREKLLDF